LRSSPPGGHHDGCFWTIRNQAKNKRGRGGMRDSVGYAHRCTSPSRGPLPDSCSKPIYRYTEKNPRRNKQPSALFPDPFKRTTVEPPLSCYTRGNAGTGEGKLEDSTIGGYYGVPVPTSGPNFIPLFWDQSVVLLKSLLVVWQIAAASDWLRRGKPRWKSPPTRDSKEG